MCGHTRGVLAPSALSCQAAASDAPGSGQPRAGSSVQGHCGGSTLTLLMQLQKPVWDHGKHSSAIKNKYIKLPETNRCLGKGKALTALTKPSQEERCQDRSPSWDALARPKTLTHAELGQTKTL